MLTFKFHLTSPGEWPPQLSPTYVKLSSANAKLNPPASAFLSLALKLFGWLAIRLRVGKLNLPQTERKTEWEKKTFSFVLRDIPLMSIEV